MKHEFTTLNTRRAFAASLKGFMGKKPLSKITVSEIIADCGVNRKTFYYHFAGHLRPAEMDAGGGSGKRRQAV